MTILSPIADRRSLRNLSAQPLPEGAIDRIVEAGHLAPSCYNNQPWRITVATDAALEALRPALSEGNAWATVAPAIIAVAVKASDDCRLDDGRDYALFDAGLCAMNMMTQATAEGLVAHPIAGFTPKKAKAALGIAADHVLPVLLVLARLSGESPETNSLLAPWQKNGESAPRNRKPLSDVVTMS